MDVSSMVESYERILARGGLSELERERRARHRRLGMDGTPLVFLTSRDREKLVTPEDSSPPVVVAPPQPEPTPPPPPLVVPEQAGSRYQAIGHPRRRMFVLMEIVAGRFHSNVADILGPRRTIALVKLRHIVMFLAWDELRFSYSQMGRILGRDHSTCLHGCNNILARISTSPELARVVEDIRDELRARTRACQTQLMERMEAGGTPMSSASNTTIAGGRLSSGTTPAADCFAETIV